MGPRSPESSTGFTGHPDPATARPSPEAPVQPAASPLSPAAVYAAAKDLQQRIRLALLASRRASR